MPDSLALGRNVKKAPRGVTFSYRSAEAKTIERDMFITTLLEQDAQTLGSATQSEHSCYAPGQTIQTGMSRPREFPLCSNSVVNNICAIQPEDDLRW
jgi:hypothetical protein